MSRLKHVEVTRKIEAPRERVWSHYVDHAGWTRWAGLGRVLIERAGAPSVNGVGCIRAFQTGGPPTREEVVAFEAPTRLVYKLLSGAPLRDHRGEVTFEDDGTGTRVTWRCDFASRVPGLGRVLRVGIGFVFRRTLKRLDRALTGAR
jgi:uncharacterized protein YndB with AHSA1/START domain